MIEDISSFYSFWYNSTSVSAACILASIVLMAIFWARYDRPKTTNDIIIATLFSGVAGFLAGAFMYIFLPLLPILLVIFLAIAGIVVGVARLGGRRPL